MQSLGRLFGYLRPYRRQAILSLIALTTWVFLDLAIPRLIQRIIDQGILRNDQAVVLETAAIMLGISLLSAVIAVGNNILSVQAGEGVARDLREALFVRIQSYSYANLDQQRTGQLLVRLTSDINALKHLSQITLRIGTRAPLMMIGSLILMISTSPNLALTLLPLLAVTSGLIVFFVLRMEPLFRIVQQKLDRLNNVLHENIAGARLVKAFVRADFEAGRFEHANAELAGGSIRVMRFMSSMTPLLTLCVNIGMVLVIWAGGLQAINGELSLGQIVAFINYLISTMTPLIMMTQLSNTWAAGLASAKRVGEILDTEPAIRDAPHARPTLPGPGAGVGMDDVGFVYAGDGNEPVLSNITLEVCPGETIAILGATGAGKSTLINLIPRFYDVTTGRVTFGGADLREVTQDALFAAVGVVPQESLLFSGTVRDNIRYGRPEAGEAEVIAAARAAQADGFIQNLSQGYDTRVEERGSNFSGGQKQRIAIARALLVQPRILILDDSTSSVDVETETKIQDALEASNGERITFVVAQRISTVLKADKIVVIERGRIAAQGTHRELLATSPIYQEIYDSQLGGGERLAAEAGAQA
ncbi:MAG TPA: ABC transporter ATP-binding protein [Thermoflexales bacterium]|nr:ABC transporter ATP-binding protein [Thermoflexales bacterium]